MKAVRKTSETYEEVSFCLLLSGRLFDANCVDGVCKFWHPDGSLLQARLARHHVVRQENLVSGLQF